MNENVPRKESGSDRAYAKLLSFLAEYFNLGKGEIDQRLAEVFKQKPLHSSEKVTGYFFELEGSGKPGVVVRLYAPTYDLKKFQTEAAIYAQNYPFVMRSLLVVEEQEQPIMVIPYLPAGDVRALSYELNRMPTYDEIVSMIKQLGTAVIHLHRDGIAHRDLKWTNVLPKKPEGFSEICLIDFDRSSPMVALDPNLEGSGTTQFMAPEARMFSDDDFLAEQYTLAILFYQLFSNWKLPLGENHNAIPGLTKRRDALEKQIRSIKRSLADGGLLEEEANEKLEPPKAELAEVMRDLRNRINNLMTQEDQYVRLVDHLDRLSPQLDLSDELVDKLTRLDSVLEKALSLSNTNRYLDSNEPDNTRLAIRTFVTEVLNALGETLEES